MRARLRLAVSMLPVLACSSVPPPPPIRAKELPTGAPVDEATARAVRDLQLAAADAMTRGEPQLAIEHADEALRRDPRNARAYALRGLARMVIASRRRPPHIDAWENVETDLLTATRLDPADPQVFYALGIFYDSDGHAAAALEAFEHALSLNPFHRESLAAAGRLHWESGRERAAVDVLDRMLTLPEPDPHSVFRLARAQMTIATTAARSGDKVAADKALKGALQAATRYREVAAADANGILLEAVVRRQMLGDVTKAPEADVANVVALFEQAATAAPKDPVPVYDLAHLREQLEDVAGASAGYQRALDRDEHHLPSLLNLARLRAEADPAAARELLVRALPLVKDRNERSAIDSWLTR